MLATVSAVLLGVTMQVFHLTKWHVLHFGTKVGMHLCALPAWHMSDIYNLFSCHYIVRQLQQQHSYTLCTDRTCLKLYCDIAG